MGTMRRGRGATLQLLQQLSPNSIWCGRWVGSDWGGISNAAHIRSENMFPAKAQRSQWFVYMCVYPLNGKNPLSSFLQLLFIIYAIAIHWLNNCWVLRHLSHWATLGWVTMVMKGICGLVARGSKIFNFLWGHIWFPKCWILDCMN